MLSQAEEIPAPFKVQPELYLDRYDWKNRKEVMEVRRQVRASQEQLAKLLMQRERLVASSMPGKQLVTPLSVSDKKDSDEPTNVVAGDAKSVLQLAIAKLEELSATIQDPDREKSQNSLIEKLKAIVALLQDQIHNVNHEIAQIREQIFKTREFDKKEIGPYQLRTVIMWNGFMGRDSIYTYVQSGTATAEIDGSPLKNPKWWKVAGDGVFEVSKDIVLNDVTGIHMLGGGSIAQSYVVAQEGEEEVTAGSIPEQLLQAIEADNAAYLAEVGKPTPVPPADATSAATDGQGTAVAPTETKDEIMQTDEEPNNKATTAQANTVTLHLRGGTSRRRMSVTSDTGSIASTSRVRLDDWDDDDDASDEFLESVELGFPVKMKKGFKVVKDVGKIGGKPVSLTKDALCICKG